MQGNRHIGESTVIAGPFFVCGEAGEELRSLTDEETDGFLQQFAEPEDISDEEVTARSVSATPDGFLRRTSAVTPIPTRLRRLVTAMSITSRTTTPD